MKRSPQRLRRRWGSSSISRIACISGLARTDLQKLNPKFVRDFIEFNSASGQEFHSDERFASDWTSDDSHSPIDRKPSYVCFEHICDHFALIGKRDRRARQKGQVQFRNSVFVEIDRATKTRIDYASFSVVANRHGYIRCEIACEETL